jgi:hypothetical protein
MPNVTIEPTILSAAVDEESAQKTITLVLAYGGEVDLGGKFTVGNTLKLELPSKPQP